MRSLIKLSIIAGLLIPVLASAQTQTLPTGWSMVGNNTGAAINANAVFGNATTPTAATPSVTTVWTWNNALSQWNFFAPSMTPQELSTYATAKGYGVLSSVTKDEGFWVNAKNQFVYSPGSSITPSETTPPTVSSVTPVHYDTGILLRSTISATFSEAMSASTITPATFTIGGVTGTVAYSGTTATFTPSSDLAVSTTYIATITTGVKDAAGNQIANNYAWTFSTCTPRYVNRNLYATNLDYQRALSAAYEACR